MNEVSECRQCKSTECDRVIVAGKLTLNYIIGELFLFLALTLNTRTRLLKLPLALPVTTTTCKQRWSTGKIAG